MDTTFKITIDLPTTLFEDVLVTALEGGSNYWLDFDPDEIPVTGEFSPAEELSIALLKDPSFELEIVDAETGEKLGVLNRANMERGFQLCAQENALSFGNIVSGNYDAVDTDILIQFAILGEIVYS